MLFQNVHGSIVSILEKWRYYYMYGSDEMALSSYVRLNLLRSVVYDRMNQMSLRDPSEGFGDAQ